MILDLIGISFFHFMTGLENLCTFSYSWMQLRLDHSKFSDLKLVYLL